MKAFRASVGGPEVLFGLGALATCIGLWILAPWLALVVAGVAAMALAAAVAMPRREA